MDPLSRLNLMHFQDPLPKPLDLTKQISEALNLVKKKPRQSSRASGTNTICSPPSSEYNYESVCVPLNTSLPNGHTHTPVITGTENGQTDGVTVQGLEQNRRDGGRETNAAGFRDTTSSRSHSRFSENLSSGLSGSGHTECVSSDDSSVIEVPVSVKISDSASVTHRVSKDKKWKEEERTEHSSAPLIECCVIQDSDSLESRYVASTSEAENEAKNGLSQTRVPATKKTRNQQHMRSSAGKKETASAVKRRRKKKKKRSGFSSSPCAFPSHEPEIKLKFSNRKDEKREGSRGNSFSPYVRMEFSVCTVVNFEEDFQVKKHRHPTTSPGIVPNTSCLQLGRLGTEGKHQSGELCCLCGRTANVAGLGDLHGPYNPCTQDRTTSEDLLINGHEDVGAKRKRRSDEIGERWVHEDCSIWSAGVFLVKGRLYGLDEALQVAQDAVCSCCHRCGATLGCFFRGCPNKYHFPCALQADCVFNEENFTLRCPKHKNKSGLGVSQPRNM